jgi:hypothetical protein
MSAFAYGRLVRRRLEVTDQQRAALVAAGASAEEENKFATAIAGLVPAEIIAAHGLMLGFTTKTENDVTTITAPFWLGSTLVVLAVGAIVLFVFGRGNTKWEGTDWIRLLIPPLAFVAWTALIGTSALTPIATFLNGGTAAPQPALGLLGVGLGILLLGLNLKFNPK